MNKTEIIGVAATAGIAIAASIYFKIKENREKTRRHRVEEAKNLYEQTKAETIKLEKIQDQIRSNRKEIEHLLHQPQTSRNKFHLSGRGSKKKRRLYHGKSMN